MATNPNVVMKKGNQSNIPSAVTDGTLYFATDTNNIFLDHGTTRYQFDGHNTQTVTGVKGNSETSYRTGNINLTPANIGAVNKSGDSMTGNLVLENSTLFVDSNNMTQGSNTGRVNANKVISLRESGNNQVAGIQGFVDESSDSVHYNGVALYAIYKQDADTASKYNVLRLIVGSDGSNKIELTSRTAWHTALNLKATAPLTFSDGTFAMPAAGASTSGYVSSGTQTFGGAKTFNGDVRFKANVYFGSSNVYNSNNSGDARFHTMTIRDTGHPTKNLEYNYDWESTSSTGHTKTYLTLVPNTDDSTNVHELFVHLGNGAGCGVMISAGDEFNDASTKMTQIVSGSTIGNENIYLCADNRVYIATHGGNLSDDKSDTYGYLYDFSNDAITVYRKAAFSGSWSKLGYLYHDDRRKNDNLLSNVTAGTVDTTEFIDTQNTSVAILGDSPLSVDGYSVSLRVRAKLAAAMTAGTHYTIAKLKTAYVPYMAVYGATSRSGHLAEISAGGNIVYTPSTNLDKDNEIFMYFSYVREI